jgi:hypothetical protein
MIKPGVAFVFTIVFIIAGSSRGICQTAMPDVLDKGTLTEQMKYLEEKTRIYEDYRAIREDMFQKIKNNSIDSIAEARSRIGRLVTLTSGLNVRIDSLNSRLDATKVELGEIARTKNSIKVIGIELNKVAYNTIMWTLVAALIFLLIVGFLLFKRNLTVTHNTKKEFDEVKTEYENYRQKTRLEREKMSMDHFNEVKKLKGIK